MITVLTVVWTVLAPPVVPRALVLALTLVQGEFACSALCALPAWAGFSPGPCPSWLPAFWPLGPSELPWRSGLPAIAPPSLSVQSWAWSTHCLPRLPPWAAVPLDGVPSSSLILTVTGRGDGAQRGSFRLLMLVWRWALLDLGEASPRLLSAPSWNPGDETQAHVGKGGPNPGPISESDLDQALYLQSPGDSEEGDQS